MKLENICEVIEELREWENHFNMWKYGDLEFACKKAKELLQESTGQYCNEISEDSLDK